MTRAGGVRIFPVRGLCWVGSRQLSYAKDSRARSKILQNELCGHHSPVPRPKQIRLRESSIRSMKILLLNQAFWPDVVASAQQLTMLARRLSERGHQVTVITSARGYDDATASFQRRERWHSVDIVRISSFSAGKRHRWQRTLQFASLLFACA